MELLPYFVDKFSSIIVPSFHHIILNHPFEHTTIFTHSHNIQEKFTNLDITICSSVPVNIYTHEILWKNIKTTKYITLLEIL